MSDFEVTPIDEEGPSIIDELPTEDTDEEPVIDDIQDDPSVPEGGEPESTEEAPEPEPDLLMYASEVDELPTEDTDEEPVIDDEPDGGEQPYEPDINENVADIPIVGSAREGDVIPVLMRSGAPLGISPVGWGDRMQSDVDLASQAATEAKAVAQATGQHFWEDDNGAHVTEITKDDWKAEEAKETPFADVSDAKPYHNLLMNSLGILLRTALKNLVSITRSAIAFFDGQGNDAANVTASFGKDGFQVGTAGKSHMTGDYHSLQLIDKAGTAYLHVSDLRDTTGYALISEQFYGDGSTLAFRAQYEIRDVVSVYIPTGSIGYTVSNNWAFVFDSAPPDGSTISVQYHTASTMTKAFTFGSRKPNTTVGGMSYAEGYNVTASGSCTHAEGYTTVASGSYSHAEGYGSKADEMYSHAEGYRTTASGIDAHSEGQNTVASGSHSHAGGYDSIASGMYSFVHGLGLRAVKPFQAVFGQYNKEDSSTSGTPEYLFIVGNGTSESDRKNAMGIRWNGTTRRFIDVDARQGGTKPSSIVNVGEEVYDTNNGDQLFYTFTSYNTAGRVYRSNIVRKVASDGSELAKNGFYFGVNEDGSPYWSIQNAPQFRNAIGLGIYASLMNQSSSLTLTTSSQKVPLHGSFSQYGGCSESSNGIKVPVAGVYLITGLAYFTTGFAVNDIIHIELRKNDSSLGDSSCRVYLASAQQSFSTPTQIVSLAANDVITLHAWNQTAARGTVANRNGHGITLVKIA